MLELSPLNSTTVPPDKTGLAPSEARPALVPLEIVETVDPPDDESGLLSELPELQTLQSVISRFQMLDPGSVSLKTKVYPFKVPLKLPSASEEIPLNTDIKGVFTIALSFTDKEEIPNVMAPFTPDAESCPKFVALAMMML